MIWASFFYRWQAWHLSTSWGMSHEPYSGSCISQSFMLEVNNTLIEAWMVKMCCQAIWVQGRLHWLEVGLIAIRSITACYFVCHQLCAQWPLTLFFCLMLKHRSPKWDQPSLDLNLCYQQHSLADLRHGVKRLETQSVSAHSMRSNYSHSSWCSSWAAGAPIDISSKLDN